ncbi:DUF4199 domain-containing protein [Pseudomarimonas arenosa]|uniref:DUF4199 domain-containing protein n=1 Tax=Pseudomarimonas arenosa TaxID=2774145 RepID=A0AAW3ZLS2_9GAMM|nr:DUF4199 domain-containing protein [Pseudomarimonas arenosa]MBD8525599.1 DUF4199 domain-containing protein [Pseudomarimonas arenosa]
MGKTIVRFGLIAGAILSAMLLLTLALTDQVGFEYGALIGYTTMVLAFLMIYFGIRSYRDTVAGGQIGFGRALLVGLLITLLSSACYVATWQVVYHQFAPDFIEKYTAYEIDKARQGGADDQQIAKMRQDFAEFAELYKNPVFNIAITFIEPLPVGVLISLISAGVLRRRRDPATATS